MNYADLAHRAGGTIAAGPPRPAILVVTDRLPVVDGYSSSLWMMRSLSELASFANVHVLSVLNVLPRLRNILSSERERMVFGAVVRGASHFRVTSPVPVTHVRVLGTPARLSWTLLPRLIRAQVMPHARRLLQDHRFDAVLSHGAYPIGLSSVEIAGEAGVPVLMYDHEGFELYPKYFGREASNAMSESLRAADSLIALTSLHSEQLKRHFPGIPCSVVPLGIDVEAGDHLPDRGVTFNVMTAARVEGNEKDIGVLVEGFAQLIRKSEDPAHLTIAGDGSELPALRRLARRCGIRENVTFTGWLAPSELYRLMRTQHVFVCASREETFGYVVLEAAAVGLPVVGLPTVGIVGEFQEHDGRVTRLAELTPEEIQRVLRTLCRNESARRKIADHARRIAAERFSWSTHRQALREVIQTTIDRHSRRQAGEHAG